MTFGDGRPDNRACSLRPRGGRYRIVCLKRRLMLVRKRGAPMLSHRHQTVCHFVGASDFDRRTGVRTLPTADAAGKDPDNVKGC